MFIVIARCLPYVFDRFTDVQKWDNGVKPANLVENEFLL